MNAWESLRPTPPKELQDLCDRTGKEVAHLTYHRMTLTEVKKQWNLYEITNSLLTVLDIFAQNADKDKLHLDVIATINLWKAQTSYEPNQNSLTLTAGSSSASIGATAPIKGV